MAADPLIPGVLLEDIEIDESVLQLGALLSILQNKRVKPAKLISTVITDAEFAAVAQQILNTDDIQETIKLIASRYPSVVTSKIVLPRKYKHGRSKTSNPV